MHRDISRICRVYFACDHFPAVRPFGIRTELGASMAPFMTGCIIIYAKMMSTLSLLKSIHLQIASFEPFFGFPLIFTPNSMAKLVRMFKGSILWTTTVFLSKKWHANRLKSLWGHHSNNGGLFHL
ncbi:unnamed protein product [Cylicocyclus nassatus]|uniref:Uncharacterized protein n=1 Tax=Cylicocyclus nassatus TaxID=53992 RepID=A0AA36MFY2_CYLNA|nr:unnamed protein product [Cylicocyclus nassatus]